jgi:hypothetical protein
MGAQGLEEQTHVEDFETDQFVIPPFILENPCRVMSASN